MTLEKTFSWKGHWAEPGCVEWTQEGTVYLDMMTLLLDPSLCFPNTFFFPVCNSDRNTTRAWLQPQHHPLKPQWPHTELPTTNPTLTWPCDTAWEEEKNMGQKAHCAASQGVLSGTHNLSIVFCMCVLLYTVRTSFIHGSEDIMASPYFLRHLQRVKSWV